MPVVRWSTKFSAALAAGSPSTVRIFMGLSMTELPSTFHAAVEVSSTFLSQLNCSLPSIVRSGLAKLAGSVSASR